MSNKTEQWVVFTAHEEALDVAAPVSWLAKGATMDLKPTTEADFVVGPGLMASPDSMDDVHAWANVVFTLVDEGYLDGDKAVLAFKEVPSE